MLKNPRWEGFKSTLIQGWRPVVSMSCDGGAGLTTERSIVQNRCLKNTQAAQTLASSELPSPYDFCLHLWKTYEDSVLRRRVVASTDIQVGPQCMFNLAHKYAYPGSNKGIESKEDSSIIEAAPLHLNIASCIESHKNLLLFRNQRSSYAWPTDLPNLTKSSYSASSTSAI